MRILLPVGAGAQEVKDTGRIEGWGSMVAKEQFLEEFGKLS
jgi:hypothetical protein